MTTPITIGSANAKPMTGLSHKQCLRVARRTGCRVYREGRRLLIDGGDLLEALRKQPAEAARSDADIEREALQALGLAEAAE